MMLPRMAIVPVVALVLISAVGCRTMTGRTAGDYIDDKVITTQVKARLAGAEAASLTRVDVDTQNGTVYLNGSVETPEQKLRAERIAHSQEGVKRVVNNLQVTQPRR
jgi:osmotically-inducible protein OsmY